jgi:hypothetical protein
LLLARSTAVCPSGSSRPGSAPSWSRARTTSFFPCCQKKTALRQNAEGQIADRQNVDCRHLKWRLWTIFHAIPTRSIA